MHKSNGSLARKQRQENAKARSAARDRRTDIQQLEVLAQLRPGESKREKARLRARMVTQSSPRVRPSRQKRAKGLQHHNTAESPF